MSLGHKSIVTGENPEIILDLGESCVIARHNAAPTSGTTGTLVGQAGPGSLLVDVTNKKWYVNKGTKASPSWKEVTVAL